jgi:hypothetical protein
LVAILTLRRKGSIIPSPPNIDFDNGLLEQLDRLGSEMATTQASTMQGLCVKARAACWALLGDLDEPGDTTTDRRMAL